MENVKKVLCHFIEKIKRKKIVGIKCYDNSENKMSRKEMLLNSQTVLGLF